MHNFVEWFITGAGLTLGYLTVQWVWAMVFGAMNWAISKKS